MVREDWLMYMIGAMRPKFEEVGAPIPASVRATFGFPSTGKKGRRIGECWSAKASTDGHNEIIIHLNQDNPMRVAGILAHELIHAAVGLEAKHGPLFKRVALAIGLQGKMTATTEGPDFHAWVSPILESAPELPHKSLRSASDFARTGRGTNRVKATCSDCGYNVRVARKWIDEVGLLHCPLHGEMTVD